jgi:ABC-2 type transport system permease protein
MRRILAQAEKEWKQLRRDRLTLALAFLLPLGLLVVFGKGNALQMSNIPVAVQDLDNTPLSRAYIDALAASRRFRIVPGAGGRPDQALDAGIARAVVILPPGLERAVQRRAEATIQALVDGADANTATIVSNSVRAVTATFAGAPTSAVIRPEIRFWYNPGLKDEKNTGPGALAVVLILCPSLLTALAMAREPEQGTVIQVYASSLTAREWLLGKALAYYLVACVQFVLTFALGWLVLGFQFTGDPAPFVVGTLVYLACAVFLGLTFGALTESQGAAIQAIQFLGFHFSLLLSGYIFPVSNIPEEIRWMAWLVPARHYVDLLRDSMLRGGNWASAAASILALALLALLLFFAGLRRLRRMQLTD